MAGKAAKIVGGFAAREENGGGIDMGLRVGFGTGQGIPMFISGSTHTAHLLIKNITVSSLRLWVYLEYFAPYYHEGYEKWDITIPAGGSEERSVDVLMPIDPGRYALRIQVRNWVNFERLFEDFPEIDITLV